MWKITLLALMTLDLSRKPEKSCLHRYGWASRRRLFLAISRSSISLVSTFAYMREGTLIDPWQRSRSTVDDPTEVMSTAAKVSRDLEIPWNSRPLLMGYALKGTRTPAHISA